MVTKNYKNLIILEFKHLKSFNHKSRWFLELSNLYLQDVMYLYYIKTLV